MCQQKEGYHAVLQERLQLFSPYDDSVQEFAMLLCDSTVSIGSTSTRIDPQVSLCKDYSMIWSS